MYQIGIYSNDRSVADGLKKINQHMAKIYLYVSENELIDEIRHDALRSDILIISMQNRNKRTIELAREIQVKYQSVIIIFLLEAVSDISDIFELEPTYLLMKPVDNHKLYAAVAKAVQKLEERSAKMLQLCFKDRLIQIPYQEIVYIASDRRYIDIHYSGKIERIIMKLDTVLNKLPDYFVRCHQSYVINIRKITKWERSTFYIGQNIRIPISRNRLQETKEKMYQYYK